MNKLTYDEAIQVENSLPPGPYEIKCFLQAPLSDDQIDDVADRMIDSGVMLTEISQKGDVLSIKAIKPAPIEGGIAVVPFIAAIALLGGLAITFYSIATLPRIMEAMVPLALILMGGLVIIKTAPAIAARR